MPSLGRWKIPQTRKGRRSISVHRLLEKERAGTLFKKHGYKLDGETTFQGLDVAIENDVGSKRSGTNPDGTRWTTRFKTPYGYLRGTTGADGEAVDCYVGPNADADKAYVVRQKTDDGGYDEDTVMLGYDSQAAAKADILRHYDDDKYIGKVIPIAMERLKDLVESKKKLVKISFATKDPEYIDPAAENEVGLPVAPRRRRGDVPSRDEVEINPTPKVEARGNNMDTHLVGEFHSPGGNDDLGKFGAALSELGAMSQDWLGDPDIGLSLATAREEEPRSHVLDWSGIGAVEDDQRTERPTEKMAMVRAAFLDELQKIASQHGIPPWVGDLGVFEQFVEGMQKEAFGLQQIGQGVRSAVGRVMPMAAAGAGPEVQAFRKGTGFFSTGIGQGLHQGGKMLAHNAPAAGQAAGLGAKEVGALGAMRPTSAGRRIAGETAIGAGHHMQHAGPGLMAMNPVGVPMGGAIEGFTRGVGKELQRSGNQAVQAAGHGLVRHAPKVGFGGEFVAGGLLGTPGLGAMAGHQLAGALGEHAMHAAHGIIPHTLGAGVQEASMAAPRLLPRVGNVIGQGIMGLKARAGHIGGKLVGA